MFTPASRPKAAKLPLLRSPIARTYPGTAKRHADMWVALGHLLARGDRSAGLQTGIAAEGRETPAATFAHRPDQSGDGETPC